MPSLGSTTSTESPKRAVIYLRVSSEEQVDNYSLSTQEDVCRKEAERRGIEIVEIFREEGRSAKSVKGRPELIAMLEFCRRNKRTVDAVIAYRLDRIARQTADYLAIRKKLADCNITVISATEPTGNTPAEKFIETMLAGFAQMDNDVRGERSRNGLMARFKTGLYVSALPLGYIARDGFAHKDPKSFDKLQRVWKLMVTGTISLRRAAQILNDQGVREIRRGGKEHLLRPQTMSRIFRNKFYAGKIVSRKYGQEVMGQHVPMVTEALFAEVQRIIDGRNRNAPRAEPSVLPRWSRNNPEFPLRSFVKCGQCDNSFTGAWSRGKRAMYAYYFCRNRCTGKSIPVKLVHEAALAKLAQTTASQQTLELFTAMLRSEYYKRLSGLQKRRDSADVELKRLYATRQALIQKNLTGVYSDDVFMEQNRLIEDQIQQTLAAKDDATFQKYKLEPIIEFVLTKLSDLPTTYASATLEQKRLLLCSIFPAGLRWMQKSLSNTKISPFYRLILSGGTAKVPYGVASGI